VRHTRPVGDDPGEPRVRELIYVSCSGAAMSARKSPRSLWRSARVFASRRSVSGLTRRHKRRGVLGTLFTAPTSTPAGTLSPELLL